MLLHGAECTCIFIAWKNDIEQDTAESNNIYLRSIKYILHKTPYYIYFIEIVCIFKSQICQTHSKKMFGDELSPLYVHLQLDISWRCK